MHQLLKHSAYFLNASLKTEAYVVGYAQNHHHLKEPHRQSIRTPKPPKPKPQKNPKTKMDGYVNVNFLWGGEIIKQDNDVLYSLDPKEMKYVKLGTSFEELRDMVFGLMHISRHHWDVKYPRIGVGNLVSGFFVKSVKSDDDVSRILSIPVRFHLGGDVSLFTKAESIAQPSQQYGGPFTQQSGQTAAAGQIANYVENYGGSFRGDYGGNYGQSEFGGMPGWFSGYNYGTVGKFGGGSSNTGRFVVEEVVEEDDLSGRQPSPRRQTPKRGATIALALENEEEDEDYGSERAISSSDDSDCKLSQEEVAESEDFL